MSTVKPLTYAGRCERYARQRGWAYDPQQMSISHLTPAQRRRALRKERRSWRTLAYKDTWHPAAGVMDCDVCGLPDPYDGTGDGIGSCECPRCDGGETAASSVLCTCPPNDDGYWADYLDDGYDGHSPADEYNIYPDDSRTTYGDTFAY